MSRTRRVGIAAAFALLLGTDAKAEAEAPSSLDCDKLPCVKALPGAVRFEAVAGAKQVAGYDESNTLLGWVALSTDLVDVKAYSGKPLATLVGIDGKGVITGARVVHHSEPILLVGIPEKALHDFTDFYAGKEAIARIVVGTTTDEGAIAVDMISGATVTALAQNKTILETARTVGVAQGVVSMSKLVPGHFVESDVPLTWSQMMEQGVFGRLIVTESEMGLKEPEGNFVDLYYTIADAPQVGRALLGDRKYKHLIKSLQDDQHLFVVLGNGSNSFKGSAFVRGGIFDRIRVVQGLRELYFRDTDYKNLSRVPADGAPRFKEGAAFISRGAPIDPGASLEFIFLGSRYDGKGAFHRDFREFKSSFRLPKAVYVLDGPDPDEAIFVQAWRNNAFNVGVLSAFLLFVIAIFTARRWTTSSQRLLKWLHIGVMTTSVLLVGFVLHAQPSVTQVLTLVDSVKGEWRWDLFASEPLLFIMWIFIAVVSIIWGRGVFCGWVCPYGAMTELLHKVGHRLGIKSYELPDSIHERLRYLRYVVFFVLVAVFLNDSIRGEQMAEIEPFKSTFFVSFWRREWFYAGWWLVLFGSSIFMWRPFCRYLCPLGGALAIFGSFRLSGPYRRNFCQKCTICTTNCEPRAIRPDGSIDSRECLSCMECEGTFRDDTACPPLIGINKIKKRDHLTPEHAARLAKLRKETERMRGRPTP